MGLFSFLKKKHDVPAAEAPGVLLMPDTRLRAGEPSRLDSEAERERQRAIARATAAKIDEIELAMTSDIFDDEPAWGSAARRPAAVTAPAAAPPPAEHEEPPEAPVAPASAPVVEESAILYANGQAAAAETLLRDSLSDVGRAERLPWWMLFDLYQALGREAEFDSIAIDYASHFETSPPTWQPLLPGPGSGSAPAPGVAAGETFGAVLDTAAAARLQRLLTSNAPLLRIDLGALRSATPEGCAALLATLQALRKQERELVLAGADTLLGVLRPMLAVGQRASGEAPWLLLLELLLLSNREKDFEESAMDYCVTFEVSPPSFETPKRVSTAAAAPPSSSAASGDRFLLPPIASGHDAALLDALDVYAEGRALLVLDCSRLARMDYACASALLTRLRVHTEQGRTVELRELNHLVAALLRLLGYGDGIRLYPHRY